MPVLATLSIRIKGSREMSRLKNLQRRIVFRPATSFAILAAALLAGLAAAPAAGQNATPDGIHWEENLDVVFLEAKKNNTPVFIAFHASDDARCRDLIEKIYTDPEVIALSRRFFCLAACQEEHDDEVMECADGLYRNVCSYFGYVTCDQHQRIWVKAVRTFLMGDRPSSLPFHIFVHPNGTKMIESGNFGNPADLVKTMKRAIEKIDPVREEDVFQAFDEDQRRFIKYLGRLKGSEASLRTFILEKLVNWEGEWVYPKLSLYIESVARQDESVHILRAVGFAGNRRGGPMLLDFSKHRDVELRRHAVVSLEEIGLADNVVGLWAWLEKERNIKIQANVLRALAASAPIDKKVISRLRKEARSNKPLLRCGAVVGLGLAGVTAPDEVRSLLEDLLDDKDGDVAACACWALGWMRSKESIALLEGKMAKAKTFREIILLEDVIHRTKGYDPFGYTEHLKKYAGDAIARGGEWPPEVRRWGLEEER